MSFAKEIGLIDGLEKRFSHLKKSKRCYSVPEKILSFSKKTENRGLLIMP